MQWEDSASWIRPNGHLDESRIVNREKIYQGRNGRDVERIQIDSGQGCRSFIYKPLTNMDTLGREVWAHRYLLPELPIRYPRMVLYSQTDDPSAYWTLHEDMGRLDHELSQTSLVTAGESIALWHCLPVERLPEAWNGHTPRVHDVIAELAVRSQQWAHLLSNLRLPQERIVEFRERFELLQGRFVSETVISHGDYHPLNLAWKNNELMILDWEYVHRNSVYWDLYNLLDITSPKHRRTIHSMEVKHAILSAYLRRRSELDRNWFPPHDFINGYRMFAAIYSTQIMLWIDEDLQSGRFETSSLMAQQEETIKSWLECTESWR